MGLALAASVLTLMTNCWPSMMSVVGVTVTAYGSPCACAGLGAGDTRDDQRSATTVHTASTSQIRPPRRSARAVRRLAISRTNRRRRRARACSRGCCRCWICPLVPTLAVTAFGMVQPATQLRLDTVGWVCPFGPDAQVRHGVGLGDRHVEQHRVGVVGHTIRSSRRDCGSWWPPMAC